MANTSFLDNVDETKVTELLDTTNKNVEYFEGIIKQVVDSYISNLDILMQNFYKKQRELQKANLELETSAIESTYLELTNLLYFMGDKLERLGIHSDMSKAARQEIYNKAYLANQIKDLDKKNKITVAELSALAEQDAQYESVVNFIYERAYKMIKFKIDAGYELVRTLSKILSRRMQEVELSFYKQPKTGFIDENKGE